MFVGHDYGHRRVRHVGVFRGRPTGWRHTGLGVSRSPLGAGDRVEMPRRADHDLLAGPVARRERADLARAVPPVLWNWVPNMDELRTLAEPQLGSHGPAVGVAAHSAGAMRPRHISVRQLIFRAQKWAHNCCAQKHSAHGNQARPSRSARPKRKTGGLMPLESLWHNAFRLGTPFRLRGATGHERRIHRWSRFDLTDSAPDGSATRSTELHMRSMHDRTAARARRSPMPQDAASAVRSSTLMLSILVLPLIT